MATLLSSEHGEPLPWKDWLQNTHGLCVHSDAHQLTMHYTFTLAAERPKIFLQSLLLADGALRLAGILDILQVIDKHGVYFDDPTTIINVSGYFRLSVFDHVGHFKKPYDEKRQQYLIVLAMRDSFMHGEIEEQAKLNVLRKEAKRSKNARQQLKRRMFRELWFKGKLAPRLPYSPEVIAKACREVAEELINVVNTYL